jgi:hypothetical protein
VVGKPWIENDPCITGERELSWKELGLRPRRTAGRFIKGPLPLSLILAAVALPGKAPVVFLLLTHFRVGASGTAWVTIPSLLWKETGLGREAKRRAIKDLETAGLIQVERRKGFHTRIRLRAKRGSPKCKQKATKSRRTNGRAWPKKTTHSFSDND